MSTIDTSDILTCNYGYDYKKTVEEIDYTGKHYMCSMGTLHIRMFYKPFIMKCFSMITIRSEPTGRKNYIYTNYDIGGIDHELQTQNHRNFCTQPCRRHFFNCTYNVQKH